MSDVADFRRTVFKVRFSAGMPLRPNVLGSDETAVRQGAQLTANDVK